MADGTADGAASTRLERYAEHLSRLSEGERRHTREQNARAAAATPEQASNAIVLQGQWTLLALDADDPLAALREAVASSTNDPEDVQLVLGYFDRIADLHELREQNASLILEAEAATAPPEETRRALWKWCQELAASDVGPELRQSAERAAAALDAVPLGTRVSPELLAITAALTELIGGDE